MSFAFWTLTKSDSRMLVQVVFLDVVRHCCHCNHVHQVLASDCEHKGCNSTANLLAHHFLTAMQRRVLGLERHLIALLIMNRELQASQELRRSW